jgi:hypothetical protein
MRLVLALAGALAVAALAFPRAGWAAHPADARISQSSAPPSLGETVAAREHFFGRENVGLDGRVRSDRVILSWASVATLAMAIDGHVVLLDTYIHKGEERPNYVPTTTTELAALRPEAIFIGHGHFDHANTAGELAVRTGAQLIGTPEHCDQAGMQAADYAGEPVAVSCLPAVDRGSDPGAQVRELRPLGDGVEVTVMKHLHSAAEPPDGEGHETSLVSGGLPDASLILLHPPGPSAVAGLDPAGDEGSSLLYQFRLGDFSLVWHDSAGPLRSQAPHVLDRLRALPPTDVQVGATLGFNDPTNGMRDPVDYFMALRPRFFYPVHHDFVAEYGISKNLEGVFRREAARRGELPGEVRWLYDPYDYLRPGLVTFDLAASPVERGGCLARRSPVGPVGIGRIRLGRTREQLLRRVEPQPVDRGTHAYRWCVKGAPGRVIAVFGSASPRAKAVLAATTATTHGHRRVRPATSASRLRRAYPALRRIAPGLFRAGPSSRRLIGVRRGRVRFVAVASRRLPVRPGVLRRYLGRAAL